LLAALNDKDESVANAAGKALHESRKMTKEHVPVIVTAAQTAPTVEGRKLSLQLLVGLATTSPGAVQGIIAAIDDKNPSVKIEAIRSLGNLGVAAAPRSVPALNKVLDGNDESAKRAAIRALGSIGPGAAAAARALAGLLKDKRMHDDSAAALVKIGKGSVPALVETLENAKDYKLRVEVIGLLGEIGPEARAAIKPLEAIAETDRLSGMRSAARTALGKIRRK
jgi:HEAT repeat protein